jgi:hypothetical protein
MLLAVTMKLLTDMLYLYILADKIYSAIIHGVIPIMIRITGGMNDVITASIRGGNINVIMAIIEIGEFLYAMIDTMVIMKAV